MNSNLIKIDPESLSVAIVGFTGECGKALTKEILKNSLFKRTLLIGRRKIDFDQEFYKRGVFFFFKFNFFSNYFFNRNK